MSSTLKTQFLDHMILHRFSPHTQKNYLLAVKGLVRFYKQSPDSLSNEQIQQYFLYLIKEKKLAWGSLNNIFCGILCFYKNVLKWDETRFTIPPRPRTKKLPSVLSEEEVIRLFEATDNLKHRVILKTAYSAGLRLSEVLSLRPEHIESDPSRMMIRVEQGKGKKDRYTLLSQNCFRNSENTGAHISPDNGCFPVTILQNIWARHRFTKFFTRQKKSRH